MLLSRIRLRTDVRRDISVRTYRNPHFFGVEVAVGPRITVVDTTKLCQSASSLDSNVIRVESSINDKPSVKDQTCTVYGWETVQQSRNIIQQTQLKKTMSVKKKKLTQHQMLKRIIMKQICMQHKETDLFHFSQILCENSNLQTIVDNLSS